MKLAKIKNRIKSVVIASALSLALLAGFPAVEAHAATGSVYTCTINRCYAHPVTGAVEDSGGAGSYATGQGMVEGCVYPTGILEVADDGNYYLTIRLSLMDYTSGHDFQVQSVGESGWSSTGYAQTGTGSDSNGTTADVVIQVPSENCIVRGTMYVEPMGRNVVFYLYPSDYNEGNNTDMNATMVTGSAASGGTAAESSSDGGSAVSGSSGSLSSGNSSLQSSGSTSSDSSTESASSDSSTGSTSSGKKLQSSISEAAKPSSESETPSTDSSTLDSAEGLSLSTAKDADAADSDSTSTSTSGNKVFQIALAVLVVGLILIGVVAAVVFYFRKNWRRWGGGQDDDE
ncbi:hypothetical protein DW177_15135 [Blautia sp. AM16-16B]|nr:hypothetical protein DW177_15135 [Blautia sp. AM16-16B]RHS54309.1 hypothetical protein DW962_02060 [Blautia sp. AM46-5]RHS58050.1 hypothetical protein DW961_04345 [Blautia sp. AM46-3MH]